jgi:hypothetical protein
MSLPPKASNEKTAGAAVFVAAGQGLEPRLPDPASHAKRPAQVSARPHVSLNGARACFSPGAAAQGRGRPARALSTNVRLGGTRQARYGPESRSAFAQESCPRWFGESGPGVSDARAEDGSFPASASYVTFGSSRSTLRLPARGGLRSLGLAAQSGLQRLARRPSGSNRADEGYDVVQRTPTRGSGLRRCRSRRAPFPLAGGRAR